MTTAYALLVGRRKAHARRKGLGLFQRKACSTSHYHMRGHKHINPEHCQTSKRRMWHEATPALRSTGSVTMASGLSAATASMSIPPCDDATRTGPCKDETLKPGHR